MIRIVLLGTGNIATHLYRVFQASKKADVVQVYGRTKNSLIPFSNRVATTSSLLELKEADVYIIAISDDAIVRFSEKLPFQDRLVIHTSGTTAMELLSSKNRKGVFWPLQTFSKNQTVDFEKIPICMEATTASDLELLKTLGDAISEKVVEINSEERAKLHLAAVFVNNFVNELYHISDDFLAKDSLSFDLLKPLIAETAKKIESLSPAEAQTGPAIRNDQKTIEKHLHLLADSPYKAIYQQLTEAIQATYGKKL